MIDYGGLLMLKRKITEKLIAWKNEENHKCLIVQGARQIGKTFSIRDFGKNNYENILEINFKETPSSAEMFSGDLNVDTIIMGMRFRYPAETIAPGKTLIFLDEIQECAEAVTALKFFSEDQRYDVIASGSLLGIDYKRPSSFPVGYVEFLKMHSLDFEEFLWAMGISTDMINFLHQSFDRASIIPESIHTNMMRLFRTYMAVGGMPEVVEKYKESEDFRVVDKTQRELLQGYLYDIAHYASADEKNKAEKCYLSLSHQLLDKENHKFQYKEVEHGGRAQKYYSSIDWLKRADIVELCRRVTDVRYDLDDYARDDFFRAYPTDLSLLLAMKDFGLKQHIVENTLSGTSKGGMYECAIADILYKKGYALYFYKNETTRQEIDFLIEREGQIIPIEVKSGNARATSLNALLKKNTGIPAGYKFIDGNAGENTNRSITEPLYMAMFL